MNQPPSAPAGLRSGRRQLVPVVVLAIFASAVGTSYFAAQRNAPLPRPATSSTRVIPTTRSAQPEQIGRTTAVTAAISIALPTLDPTELAVGADVYENLCASCHGERGEGQPNWWVALPNGSYPASPHDASGHTWHHSDTEIERIVREGGRIYLPQSTMPAYGHVLQPDEIRAVIVYLKSFWGPRERAVQADISREVEGLASPTTETNPRP